MKTATFTMRPPTEEDIPRLLELSRLAQAEIGEESTATREDVLLGWQTPGYDRERDSRVVVMEGEIVGRGGVGAAESERTGQAGVGGYTVPEHRRKGIGTALMTWGLETVRPSLGLKEIFTNAHAVEADRIELVEAFGFEHVRSFFWMLHPDPGSVSPPEWPDGMRVDNTLRGDELLDALIAAYEGSFIDHWNFHQIPREYFEHFLQYRNFDPEMVFIAFSGDEIAGYCTCMVHAGENVRRGEVAQLGTTRPYRKIGLGRALLRHGVRELLKREPSEVGIGVDTENPSGALGLYERTGFEVRREMRVYRLTV